MKNLPPSELVWYHGTPRELREFTLEDIGHSNEDQGPGVYFSSNFTDARGYAFNHRGDVSTQSGYVYEFTFPAHRNFVSMTGRIPITQLEQLLRMAPDYRDKLLDWDERVPAAIARVKACLRRQENPFQAFLQIWYNFYRYCPEDYVANMVTLGYDGVLIQKDFMNIKHFIAYNLKRLCYVARYEMESQ